MKVDIEEVIQLPEKIEVKIENNILVVKGSKGENKREFVHPKIKIEAQEKTITVKSKNATKREKTMLYTFVSHIKNLVKGVNEGFIYKMKICAGHFPMNVSISNNMLSVKNFLGEKIPRTLQLDPNIKIDIQGDIITLEGINKEKVGQTAADIEQLTRITNKDVRIFQDGIYILEKAGKVVLQ